MFSGVKSKLQQWRQKKKAPKLIAFMSKDTIRQIAAKNTQQLQNLHLECKSVIQQLIEQVAALSAINEDTTAVSEKISSLDDNVKAIENGLKESEEFTTCLEFTSLLSDQINNCTTEITDLHHQASSLVKENRKLRTELQVVQDHYERFEIRAVELEVQNDHLKFVSSLPNWKPFFDEKEETKKVEHAEQIAIKPKSNLPFIEDDDDNIDDAGSYILSVLDSVRVSDNRRLKILFDLIKSYIENKAYDIAIPLLKTTVEDLVSKFDPQEKIVFTMMGVMAIVFNVTKRYNNAIDVQNEILGIRKESMTEDNIGLAKTLSSLALLNGKIGKIKASRKFCRQALELKIKVYGESDIETAKELHNLGILYSYDEKYPKSIDCLVRAMKIFQASTKKAIYWFARGSANLASVRMENDNLPEAKKLFLTIMKTLNNHFDKILEGSNFSKEDILNDENKIEEISDTVNKSEIKRMIQLVIEVKEKLNSLSGIHVN